MKNVFHKLTVRYRRNPLLSPKNRLIWVVLAKELNETKGGRPKDLMSLGRADEMLSCNTTTLRRGFAHLVLSSKESIDMYYHSRFFLIELEPCA